MFILMNLTTDGNLKLYRVWKFVVGEDWGVLVWDPNVPVILCIYDRPQNR